MKAARGYEYQLKNTHAVVIGGSFAGLCAGRVLSDFFDHVTVLDRDTFPAGAEDRAGVPQARHVHGLLVRGLEEYERLFPGLERLESCVRDLFRTVPNAQLRERTAVTGLAVSRSANPRCVGVEVPSDAGGKRTVIEADLVVDASGAVSRAPMWLEAAGLKPPRETIVDPLAGYSSRWFQGPPREQWPPQWWWWAGAYIRRRPDDLVEANFQLKEHGRWHLTLSGFNRRYPPTCED